MTIQNPLIAHLKNARREIGRSHTTTPETELRVTMTRQQLDNIILTIEDADYFAQAIHTVCDMAKDMLDHANKIDDIADHLLDKKKSFAENGHALAIKEHVAVMNEIYGKGAQDDDEQQSDSARDQD